MRRRKTPSLFSGDRWKAGGTIAALVAAVAVFIVMLQIEKSVLAEYEKGTVYVAAERIPKGRLVTENDYSVYFREQETDISCIAASALRSPQQLAGLAAKFDIEPGVILTEEMFESLNEIWEQMEEPVIAGFKADDLYQVVGGTVRPGDRIHVYRVNEDKEAVLIWENVYVAEVFDQTGNRIESDNSNAAAQRINVYLDKADVAPFYAELAAGTLRVVKVCK